MPVRRQGQTSRSKFALSDSDSEEEICLTLVRYQEAEIGPALHTRANFKRATEELTALVRQAYVQHADKTVQEIIFEDALSAIRKCSRLERDRKAVGGLLEAVKQRLPQSRVRKAQQEYKKRFVSLSRKDRPSDIAEEDAEGDDTVLGELPLEVLQHMFTLLDPVTLGVVSCVCSTWHSLSQDESLWQRCLAQVTLVNSSSSSSSRQHTRSATSRQLFNAVVASKSIHCLYLTHFESNPAAIPLHVPAALLLPPLPPPIHRSVQIVCSDSIMLLEVPDTVLPACSMLLSP
ncbi:hypothetical protein ABBQ32_003756 [Trebouxia sp. C0010 RCD-2024]